MQEIVIGNNHFSVGKLIGKGNEGEVYAVNGRSGQVIKIYNARLRSDREDKVRAMVAEGVAKKTELVAFPNEIVFDPRGNFLGFVMRHFSGYLPLHELYSPKSRQRHFPKVDYRFVVRAALNVARVVGKAHQMGCVIGDLNHSGVLVAQDATVALIDADSFQFRLNGKSYPCVVGVLEFTPPELHGKNLAAVERTIAHDNFGLAVAIFHLLFMGRHPYAGRFKGPDISMGDAIAQNRFAFSLTRQAATQTAPPPGAPTLDLFPDAIRSAFEEAFGLNASMRPSTSGWIDSLTKLEGSLSRCSRVSTHYYPSSAKFCVWCKLLDNSGFDMFPDLLGVASSVPTDVRGTEQAIREILAIRFPNVADLLPQTVPARRGSNALREAKNSKRGSTLLGLLMMAAAVAGFVYATPAWFVWIGLGLWGLFFVGNREVDVSPFLKAYKEADERVQRELDSFVRRNGLTEVVKVHRDLGVAISAYRSHDEALSRGLMKLKSSREARQRTAYLDQFSIRRAKISGIGPVKTATLISFGIETAADVNESAIQRVPGFGDVMTSNLMGWRRMHERLFRYNPAPNAQDIVDEKALRARLANEKIKLESTIRSGLGTLRSVKPRLDALPVKARSDRALLEALEERARSERDLLELDVLIPRSTVTLNTALLPQTRPTPVNTPNISTTIPPHTTGTQGVPNCPLCSSPMRRRTGRYGRFWGCSRYPSCRGTRK